MAKIEAHNLKKKERREEARKNVFAATGGAHGRYKRLARIEQAIGQIPDTTANKVVEKVATIVKEEAGGVKKHITEELDARLGPRREEPDFKTVHEISTYMANERASLKMRETTLRHCLVQNREEEKAKKKEEKAAKKQRRT